VVALGAFETAAGALVDEEPAERSVVDPADEGALLDVLSLLLLLLLEEETASCPRAI
jgi:hypothetical protein